MVFWWLERSRSDNFNRILSQCFPTYSFHHTPSIHATYLLYIRGTQVQNKLQEDVSVILSAT